MSEPCGSYRAGMAGTEPGASDGVGATAAGATGRTLASDGSGAVGASRWGVLALSPRAAVLLAAVVVSAALVVVLVGAVAGSGGSRGSGALVSVTGAPTAGTVTSAAPVPSAAGAPPTGASSDGAVVVHVIGAVSSPGLVTLPAGSRVSDAVERAGGATDSADLTRVNLARVVADGERLWVPAAGETEAPAAVDGTGIAPTTDGGTTGAGGTGGAGASAASPDAVVDLNTADRTTLETLPGIGPSLADRIIAWRDAHGRFQAVEDLLDVSGIGDGRFADLRDRVRV